MSVAEPEKKNIHDPLHELCVLLGLNYDDVAEIRITPLFAEATVYLLNDAGHKYLDALGLPATATVAIPVVT